MYPELRVRPRPEPDKMRMDDHDAWADEYKHWGALRCPCGRGYFCREHGDWISGDEVGSGTAVAADTQKHGLCPSYHYGGISPYRCAMREKVANN